MRWEYKSSCFTIKADLFLAVTAFEEAVSDFIEMLENKADIDLAFEHPALYQWGEPEAHPY